MKEEFVKIGKKIQNNPLYRIAGENLTMSLTLELPYHIWRAWNK